jgi:hypothetical protein
LQRSLVIGSDCVSAVFSSWCEALPMSSFSNFFKFFIMAKLFKFFALFILIVFSVISCRKYADIDSSEITKPGTGILPTYDRDNGLPVTDSLMQPLLPEMEERIIGAPVSEGTK